jgi:hypothetical protein
MVAFAPVDAPPVERPVVNLLGAARTPQGETVRWQEGTAYETGACSHLWLADVCAPGTVVEVRAGIGEDNPEGRVIQTAAVYGVAEYECMALPGLMDTFRDRALASLDAELPRLVEHELWTGALAQASTLPNRFLEDAGVVDDITPAGGAVSPALAVGLLESALADVYSGVGIIHLDRVGASYLPHVTRTGRLLETRSGNRVVPGVGYPGTGPGGAAAAAGATWLYITPMVTVRLGTPEAPDEPSIDRETNRAHVTARVPFEVSWDGCAAAFAVQMTTA